MTERFQLEQSASLEPQPLIFEEVVVEEPAQILNKMKEK